MAREPQWNQLRSPKLTPKDRLGIHGWIHYLAGFSPRFVESVLHVLAIDSGSNLLDPFVGAGTTTLVAKKTGIDYTGLDLNPIGCVVARAKLSWDVGRDSVRAHVQESLRQQSGPHPSLELEAIFRQNPEALDHILALGAYFYDLEGQISDFLLAATALTLGDLARRHGKWNPTWLKKDFVFPSGSLASFDTLLADRCYNMLSDLEAYRRNLSHIGMGTILFQDVRKFDTTSGYDIVITSPPYLSRIDYLVSHRLENEFIMGVDREFRKLGGIQDLRLQQVGSVRIDPDVSQFRAETPRVVELLDAVHFHLSKAARSYYLPTVSRYFHDTAQWIGKVHRWLQPGGYALVVVQTSYFKDVEIPLGDILGEIALYTGFASAEVVRSERVALHRGRMDPEQRYYVQDKVLTEQVVAMQK